MRAFALPMALLVWLLGGCAEDDLSNDYSNRLGWTVEPDGVGPIRLGWTVADAVRSGLFEPLDPEPDGACGAHPPGLAGDYRDPEAQDGVLYVNWSYEGLDHVGGLLIKHSSDFRTAEDIGIGSTRAEARDAYGELLQTAEFDWVNQRDTGPVPVVYGEGGALVLHFEDGVVAAMQVVPGRPGERLVNPAPGGC